MTGQCGALAWWAAARRPMFAAIDGVGCLTILGRASDNEMVELSVLGNIPGLDSITWRSRSSELLLPLGFRRSVGWEKRRGQWGDVEWTTPIARRTDAKAAA